MMDDKSLGKSSLIPQILERSLNFSFKLIDGYIFSICHEFYIGLTIVDSDLMILRIMVQRRTIDVTPMKIATYIGY